MTEAQHRQAKPDYDRAIAYALDRLRGELPPHLYYHCVWHTEDDVLPAIRRLSALAQLGETDTRRLEVAAAFHDLGYIRRPQGHEAIGSAIMADVLPSLGFSSDDIHRIAGLIGATRMPQSPRNFFEQLLADADLDVLGREDFMTTSKALWDERDALGMKQTWSSWLDNQLQFLRGHRYFTTQAQTLRDAGKQENIELVESLLRESQRN